MVIVLSLFSPAAYSDWIGQRYGQQEAVDAQERSVIPHLLAQEPGLVITVWPTLDMMSGSLLTLELRAAGWRVASLEEARSALEKQPPDQPTYWYRDITCWSRKVRGGRASGGLHPACEALERSAPWRPALLFEVSARSDSDVLLLGDGEAPIELGLFRLGRSR